MKRVVSYYGSVGRKPVFDFYDETESNVLQQLRANRVFFIWFILCFCYK